MLNKIDGYIEWVEKFLIIGIFSILVLSMSFDIFTRNVTGTSYQAISEFLPGMVLWLALLGASLGLSRSKHIKLEILVRYLPKKWQATANAASALFGATVMVILLYCSLDFIKNEIEMFPVKGYVALVFPIFFMATSFRFFKRFVTEIKAK